MRQRGRLRIATCQFPVTGDVAANGRWIRKQMEQASRRKAEVVHFSETALSGYAGLDFKTFKGFDWAVYDRELRAVMALAKKRKLWVVVGGSHRLTGRTKPHNSLYVITPQGRILDRYDKRFCTSGDLKNYSAGDHFVTFTVNGVKCGLLICYDARFPELYRAYNKLGVELMFHSFHNARGKKKGIWFHIMRTTVQAHAGINYMWISMNNASTWYQQWPSVLIQPDGVIARQLTQHKPGMIVAEVDTRKKFYQAVGTAFERRAMAGVLCSAPPAKDARSRNRQGL